jgi:hypothetical protein
MVLDYNLGEMKSTSGAALRYEVDELATDLAINISGRIENDHVYQEIAEVLKSDKTLLYFQKIIKSEIRPLVRDLCVIRWYQRNNQPLKDDEKVVLIPKYGIYPLLAQILKGQEIPVRIVEGKGDKRFSELSLHLLYKSRFRTLAKHILDVYIKWKYSGNFRGYLDGESNIALEYTEGLDLNRRSDIIWFPKSGIDPRQILIYFNCPDHSTGKPVSEEVLAHIEELGMKWVCLKFGSIARKNAPVWFPSLNKDEQIKVLSKPQGPIEKWIYQKAGILFKEVNYWSAFYKEFNIKLNFAMGDGTPQHIAQSMAFDLNGSKGGLLVGKQRSEYFFPADAYLAQQPKDIFFAWNTRIRNYIKQNLNQISSYVVVGYPNDLAFEKKIKEVSHPNLLFKSKEVDFVVALFDNVHGPHIHFSTEMMKKFYQALLNWLVEDKTLGIIIKSKKPHILSDLPEVLPLLEKAEKTGRCIRLGNEFGRLAIDAAVGSDMAVGIGISSAVIESVITGCRGLHCDLTSLRSHEYYQWGFEKIIFDNISRMIDVLKKYKADRNSVPDLGDWTPFLDKLDPYRDGRAGERMGTYLRWCLEGFDAGLDREIVLKRANKKYAAIWGADNIYANA